MICAPPLSPGHESRFALATPDGFTLYGIRNNAGDTPSDRLMIIAHGLGGYATEYLHQTAAHYFVAKGYDVVRFFFYTCEKNARRLSQCMLKDHVADLNLVIAHFRPEYQNVFIAGHSYGGMTALMANPDVNAVSMWDSTLFPYKDFWDRESRYDERLDCYILDYGYEVLVSKAMVEESSAFDFAFTKKLANAMTAPVQLLVADEGLRTKGQQSTFKEFPEPSDFALIPGAGHCFTEGGAIFDLLDKTYYWFGRFQGADAGTAPGKLRQLRGRR